MRIAILGTAQGWELLDPREYDEIWGLRQHLEMIKPHRVFEIHNKGHLLRYGAKNNDGWSYDKIVSKLAECGDHAVIHPSMAGDLPEACILEVDGLLEKFGRVITSSAAWMLAQAIVEEVDHITISGINMQTGSEYAHQKPGGWYMVGYARASGIEVECSEHSTLMNIPYVYGHENPPAMIDILDKKEADAEARRKEAEKQANYWAGCKDGIEVAKKSMG